MSAPVVYQVKPVHPAAHLFEVTQAIAAPDRTRQVLRMAAWIPGSYMVRDFSRQIVEIVATDAQGPVALERIDKQTWAASGVQGTLLLRYTVYAWELTVRTAHLDQTHGYFNGTSLFLSADGLEDQPHRVRLLPPDDPACAGWQVATTLPRIDGEPHGFGTFEAADFDELIDHPVELGTFVLRRFTAAGVPHELAVTGRQQGDLDRLAADTARICEAHAAMFGGLPMDRYLFQLTVTASDYGGLEHRTSTSLLHPRKGLPRPDSSELSDDYRGLLGLISHEYFHLWNVKRIKPATFTPYDLRQESPTTLLWAFEGITSYYDDLGLLRAGLIDVPAYLRGLGQEAARVYRYSGRHKQSLADSSFDAWTKLYKQTENSVNSMVNYYTKGALAALALDLTLRLRSDGRVSLDDLMRTLWARHGQTGTGVPEDGVERLAAELLGEDLGEFFDLAIRGTDDLPLAQLLEPFGVAFRLRPEESPGDKGGKPSSTPVEELRRRGDLRVLARADGGGTRITHVLDGGAAQAAGLSADDVVIALDGLKVGGDLLTRIADLPAGTSVTLHAFRRDELMTFTVALQPPPDAIPYLELIPDAPPEAVARRVAWLGA